MVSKVRKKTFINYQENANQSQNKVSFVPVKMGIMKQCWLESDEINILIYCC